MKKQGKKFGIILIIGFTYFIWIRITGIAIPCLFRMRTGWLCPGCGITTLFLDLIKLDIKGAYNANPFLFVTGPWIVIFILWDMKLKYEKRQMPKAGNGVLVLYLIALCVFGIWRNIVRYN
ncbi:MAG: DUF2752 domain-containing protein [Anaerostipes sp.]|jgi:hypothetical protein